MSKLPSDEEKLINFLRQYRPLPPDATPDLEEQLMAKIARSSPQKSPRWLVIVSGAIAALLMLLFGGFRFWYVNQQMAIKNQENEEIEAFLTNSWEGSLRLDESDSGTNLESDWSGLLETNQQDSANHY